MKRLALILALMAGQAANALDCALFFDDKQRLECYDHFASNKRPSFLDARRAMGTWDQNFIGGRSENRSEAVTAAFLQSNNLLACSNEAATLMAVCDSKEHAVIFSTGCDQFAQIDGSETIMYQTSRTTASYRIIRSPQVIAAVKLAGDSFKIATKEETSNFLRHIAESESVIIRLPDKYGEPEEIEFVTDGARAALGPNFDYCR